MRLREFILHDLFKSVRGKRGHRAGAGVEANAARRGANAKLYPPYESMVDGSVVSTGEQVRVERQRARENAREAHVLAVQAGTVPHPVPRRMADWPKR